MNNLASPFGRGGPKGRRGYSPLSHRLRRWQLPQRGSQVYILIRYCYNNIKVSGEPRNNYYFINKFLPLNSRGLGWGDLNKSGLKGREDVSPGQRPGVWGEAIWYYELAVEVINKFGEWIILPRPLGEVARRAGEGIALSVIAFGADSSPKGGAKNIYYSDNIPWVNQFGNFSSEQQSKDLLRRYCWINVLIRYCFNNIKVCRESGNYYYSINIILIILPYAS